MSNVKLEIKSGVESQNERNSIQTIKREIVKSEYSIDVDEKQPENNNNKVFKQNVKNRLSVASLEFEEVSSLSSSKYSDFTISSVESFEDDVENIIMCVDNELAFRNYKDSKKDVQEKTEDKKPKSYREANRSYDHIKYNENNSRSSRTHRNKSNKRNRSEEDHCSRYRTPPRRGGSRDKYSPVRGRRSRSWDRSRSRYLSNKSRQSRSSERSRRYRDSGNQSYKGRRRRRSRSRSRSRSNSYRSPRLGLEKRNSLIKRRRLSSESPVRSIWKLLDRRKPVSSQLTKSPQPPKSPPLPKLPPPPNSPPPPKPPSPVEKYQLVPQSPLTINNVTNVISSSYPWATQENHSQNVYQFQNSSMPRVSINNLPLVPGFGNLPVHVTVTGEQILHDMEGRPIPVGPNGLLLPLDLSGRLYPHIVFPYNNQAVPIYMSEDGILRLPNGEPVPYGPPNQLPVNIDGCFIPIGPDSRPLYPCPNLPRQNPLITFPVPNTGSLFPPPAPPEDKQPQIINPPSSVQQINTNANAVQQLRQLPPTVIQIETVPDLKIKTEMKSDSKPAENIQKAQSKSLVNVKIQKRKLFEDVDLPELVLTFSEKVKNINISAIYKKRLEGIDKGGVKGAIEKSEAVAVEGVSGKGDKDQRADEKNSTKDNEISSEEADQEKKYKEIIQEAISFFSDIDFKPPLFGRFLFSESSTNFKAQTGPNESPLVRNKIQLPFLVPENIRRPKSKRPSISFRFLSQKTGSGVVSETGRISSIGLQCDFTSKAFKILQTKIEKLKRELFRSRNENAELTDLYNSLREESQKKTDELCRVLKKLEDQSKMIKNLTQERKCQ